MFALGGLRATKIAARTMYRELRAAGYNRAEMLAFANAFLESVLDQGELSEGESKVARAMTCPETGLMMGPAFVEAVEFERRRSESSAEPQGLALVALETRVHGELRAPEHRALHVAITECLDACFRGGDTVGKAQASVYVIALPGARAGTQEAVRERLKARLSSNAIIASACSRDELELFFRFVVLDPSDTSADELFARLWATQPQQLAQRFADEAPAANDNMRTRHPSTSAPPRPAINVVLCGGASRALAHIGALRALCSAGFEISGVAGASVGALIGAMFCRGMTPDEILGRFAEAARGQLARKMLRAFAEYRSRTASPHGRHAPSYLAMLSQTETHAVSREDFTALIELLVGRDLEMSQLALPFATSAADLAEGRSVVLTHGSLHAALRGTFALPGLFPAERHGERLLVDGSALSEAPIAAAHALPNHMPNVVLYLRRPVRRVTEYANSHEVTARLHALVHRELVREQLREASVVITLPVHDYGFLELGAAEEIAKVGEAATVRCLDDLRRSLSRASPGANARGENTDSYVSHL